MYKFYENSFYSYELHQRYIDSGSWPNGGVDVSEEVFEQFLTPPNGKKRGTAQDGTPCWVDDIVDYNYPSMAVVQRDIYLAQAASAIAPLQDAVDLEISNNEEAALLKKWKQYRVALNRLDLSTAPDITWPALPTAVPA